MRHVGYDGRVDARSHQNLVEKTRMGLLKTAASGFDVAIVRFAQRLTRGKAPSHADRLARLAQTAETYQRVSPEVFFAPPPEPSIKETWVRGLSDGGEVVDLTWESGWVPHDVAGREAYLQFEENRIAHARLLRHATTPAPTIVCLHGYRAGVHRFEEIAWRARWLYSRLGLDVALVTLPFHALRAPRGRFNPLFPSMRTDRTVEGFGQAVWDVRSLIAWLRARGVPRLGLAGMSLGGYTAALLATVESRLDWVILFIPLGDLTDVAVEHEALRGRDIPEPLRVAGKAALRIVRPLARTPVVPGDRMLVVAAAGDRITETRTHADRLAAHFGAPLVVFPGGHLLQFGRKAGLRAMKSLIRAQIAAPPAGT